MTLLNMNGWTIILPPQGENGQGTAPQLALLALEVTVKQAREGQGKERPASFQVHMILVVGLKGELVLLPYSPAMRFVQLAQPVMDIGGAQAPKIVTAQDMPPRLSQELGER